MLAPDVKTQFGTSVRKWRTRLGISQEELAGRAGLHRTYVSDVERGARNLSLESIQKLASALEVSVSRLFAQSETLCGDAGKMVDILFVEDRPDDVALTLAAFKQAKLNNNIFVVRDGAEALDYLFCRGQHAQRRGAAIPQMILLDLDLPKINGIEVLRQVKADPQTKGICVIVLTASRHDRDIAESQRLGADAYIVKPVGFQNLSEVTPQLSMRWSLTQTDSGCLAVKPKT